MSYQKVALVTGSAKRIGKEIVKTLHQAKYRVVIHCNHSIDSAQQLANELNSIHPNTAKVIQADLTEHSNTITDLGHKAQALYGRLDLLVNNASSFYPTSIGSVDETIWNDLMGTNLKAPFFLSQACQTALTKTQGNIINIVDIHADRPLKDYPVYCMAKAALAMLTKSLSRELAPNIRVNGIAPGAILWHENELSDNDKNTVINEIALQRLGNPQDIAQGILYLINAEYITGQIIAIDGGRSVHGGEKA